MAKSNKYIVPANEQKAFDLMVQRANRRIQANLKYLTDNGVKDEQARRALMGVYSDKTEWNTAKTVFSRSKTFESEKDYKQYVRHVLQWGDTKNHRSVDEVREGYYKSIIRSLNTLAMESGADVLYKNGRLPVEITRAVKSMTLEQLTHYFDEGDASDDLEYLYYKWEDFAGVESREDFVSVALAHINTVKKIYPSNQPSEKLVTVKKPKKRKKRRKKRKNRKK